MVWVREPPLFCRIPAIQIFFSLLFSFPAIPGDYSLQFPFPTFGDEFFFRSLPIYWLHQWRGGSATTIFAIWIFGDLDWGYVLKSFLVLAIFFLCQDVFLVYSKKVVRREKSKWWLLQFLSTKKWDIYVILASLIFSCLKNMKTALTCLNLVCKIFNWKVEHFPIELNDLVLRIRDYNIISRPRLKFKSSDTPPTFITIGAFLVIFYHPLDINFITFANHTSYKLLDLIDFVWILFWIVCYAPFKLQQHGKVSQ